MNKKLFVHNLNLRFRAKQFKELDNICNELKISKAEFIRNALDKEIEKYLAPAR